MMFSINEKFNFLNYLMNRRSSGAALPYSSRVFLTSLQTCLIVFTANYQKKAAVLTASSLLSCYSVMPSGFCCWKYQES